MNFFVGKTNKACQMLDSKNEVRSSIHTCYNTPVTCPFRKGNYNGTNCYFDLSKYSMFPLNGFYWKSLLTLENVGELLCCVVLSGKIV